MNEHKYVTYDYFGLVVCFAIILVFFINLRTEKKEKVITEPPKMEVVSDTPVVLESSPSNIFTVKKILDGDTIVGENKCGEIRIRFASIDAPEATQFYGDESAKYLSDLILDKQIMINDFGVDKYNRTVATVFLDKLNVNEKMVIEGYAWYYPLYARGCNYEEQQNKARKDGKGMWSYKRGLVSPTIYRKLKTLGNFGLSLYDYGFYLDRNGVLHNKLCPAYVRPNLRWNGYDPYTNCESCGGCFVE